MCRIFAVRSNEPVAVHSAFDGLRRLAEEHKDGWGIAHFDPTHGLEVELRVDGARDCPRFLQLGKRETRSLAVHIRLASVGTVHARNNHPFVADPWVFMHNGTLKQFESVRARFEGEIDAKVRATFRGETDSERCFGLFRTYLGGATDSASVKRALLRVFHRASELCDGPGEGKRSAMNFLVTDGTRYWCTRRDRTLFSTSLPGLAAIAREHLDLPGVTWTEVPNDHLVTIDETLRLQVEPITFPS